MAASSDTVKNFKSDNEGRSLLAPSAASGSRLVETYNSVDNLGDESALDLIDATKYKILDRSKDFHLEFDPDRGYRAKEVQWLTWQRPHMRAFHASWICFFASFFVQFSPAPLLPEIQRSLNLSSGDIWLTNMWMMIGGIPMRFLLGPLCDKYGARTTMTTIVGLAAIPVAATALVNDLYWLSVVRFFLGAVDSFVPGQYWITCMFVREVGGTAMAVAGGLGATGAGVTQLFTGSLMFTVIRNFLDGDSDLAWRLALLVPACLALIVSYYFNKYSDDCPLGNFTEVKQAGLMIERSAVDSFRSGALNLNSWILFAIHAGSCGADFTMCNGTALYFHYRYHQSIAASGAIAFLYGIFAIFARGLGGWLSDEIYRRYSLSGRLWLLSFIILAQGFLNIWFAKEHTLANAIGIMVGFAVVIQISLGVCFSIVPYVDGPNTGSVAGIVGAGGNVGGAVFALVFMRADYGAGNAMETMGWLTCVTALFVPFITIRGYSGIFFGEEQPPDSLARLQASPLMVPGKMSASPHLVSLAKRKRERRR